MRNWNWALRTDALRDLNTGALISRYRPDAPDRTFTNSTGTMLVVGSYVRELPPRVNWPLLALCQAILALPLVLTWLALRWRRKRRLRLAGAAA